MESWVVGAAAMLLMLGIIIGLTKDARERLVKFLTRHKFPGKEDFEQHRAIYTALIELRALADADRAYIIQFHNGHEFLLSDPVWKCSCTHEVVRPGVTYESVNIQDMLVSRMSDLVEPIISGQRAISGMAMGMHCSSCPYRPECERTHKYLVVIQVEDMASGYTKFFLQRQNIKTVVMAGLTSKHGPFGIVGIDITSSPVSDPARIDSLSAQICQTTESIRFLFLKKDIRLKRNGKGLFRRFFRLP